MVTEATVKVHVKSILRKLGVMNRTQAAIWGMSRGLIETAPPLGASSPIREREVVHSGVVDVCESGGAYLS